MRVPLAAVSRAEFGQNRVQPPNPIPTIAMSSLDQLLTVAAPDDTIDPAEPADQPITPEQSREHAKELTPNSALVEPIDGLTLHTDTETLMSSPKRRASEGDHASASAVSERSRYKTAVQ